MSECNSNNFIWLSTLFQNQLDGEDDDVMFVDEIKTEPPLDIQAPQNAPSAAGEYNDLSVSGSVSVADLIPASNHHHERKDADEFGRFVAQSLAKLPTEIQRRKLEIEIEAAILNAKRAAYQ